MDLRALVAEFDAVADPHVRARGRDLAAGIVDAHGAGLARVLTIVAELGPDVADRVLPALLDDPEVAALLILHDLHPVDVDTRFARAVDDAHQRLGPLAAEVALERSGDDGVRVTTSGAADTPQARTGIVSVVERVLARWAPDLDRIDLVSASPGVSGSRTSLPLLT